MSQLLLLFLCATIGILLRVSRKSPPQTPAVLNAVCLHAALPALTLLELHRARFDGGSSILLAGALMPWLMFALSWAVFSALSKYLKFSPAVTGALVLTAGLGNTSFVGFPLLEALLGPAALPVGVVVDQLGSFLALATVGVWAAFSFAATARAAPLGPDGLRARRPLRAAVLSRVIRFTPFWATCLALATRNFEYPDWLSMILARLASTLVPLALISVGFQSRWDRAELARVGRPLIWGLGFKLLAFPLLCWATWWMVARGAPPFEARVVLLEAAMAPMITAGVLAEEAGLDAPVARAMVTIGIAASLVSVPLWSWVLSPG